MAYVPEDARGRASGLMTALLFAGQFASPFVSAALLAHTDLHGLFFWFALGALLVATLLTVNVLRSSGKRRTWRKRPTTAIDSALSQQEVFKNAASMALLTCIYGIAFFFASVQANRTADRSAATRIGRFNL